MESDYIASGDSVNGTEADFSQTPPATGVPHRPSTPTPGDLGTKPPGSFGPFSFTPPFTFNDPNLIQFYLSDGPYLDLHTDKVYFALILCVDPQSGWAFPSIADIAYLARMKPTAVRKYLKYLCEPAEEGGLGKFTKEPRQNGSESNGYFLNAWANDLVPEPMNPPSDDPLEEAKRLAAEKVRAEKEWEIEARDLHIEQLKQQVEALGATPVTRDEPLRAANSFVTRRSSPPPLPEEPPPPDYRDVDDWVFENWERLKAGGIKSFVGYREWVRKNPGEIEVQEEKWRAADRAEERVSQGNRRDDPAGPRVPVWDGPPSNPEAEELWRTVLENLQAILPRPTFQTWLQPTVGMAIVEGEVKLLAVTAPTPFAVEWLERRMFMVLTRELERVAGRAMKLRLVVRGPTAEDESTQGGDSDSGHGGD